MHQALAKRREAIEITGTAKNLDQTPWRTGWPNGLRIRELWREKKERRQQNMR